MRRLFSYLARYKDELRADLREQYGVDLAALFHERRWVTLLGLIDSLRRPNRFWSARLNDPEFAEMVLRHEDENGDSGEWAPPLEEYDLLAQLISHLIDVTGTIPATIAAVVGGKSTKPKPFPRPRTAIDLLREKRSAEMQADIISIFAPHAA